MRVLFAAKAIAARNRTETAKEIDVAGLHGAAAVSILKGRLVFAADLIRALDDAGRSPEGEFIDAVELSHRDGLDRRGDGAPRHRDRRRADATRCLSTTSSNPAARAPFAQRGGDALRAARAASVSRSSSTSRASWRSRSRPTTSASSAPTCSSSATAWTSPTPSGNCRSWGWSRTEPRSAGERAVPRLRCRCRPSERTRRSPPRSVAAHP